MDRGAGGRGGVEGGSAPEAGASAATAGTNATPVEEPPPSRPMDALIDAPRIACPELVSGTLSVMGTSVDVLAGERAATPGPLLIAWHGAGATGRDAIQLLPAEMRAEIVAGGGLILAPNSDGETARRSRPRDMRGSS